MKKELLKYIDELEQQCSLLEDFVKVHNDKYRDFSVELNEIALLHEVIDRLYAIHIKG